MEPLRHLVATGGSGFRLFPRFSGPVDLALIVTGCARWAP
jgi:hypothetical protein